MNSNKYNILFTCIGRRVSLLKSFRESAKQLGLDTEIIGADATELSPALQMCNHKYIVDSVEQPSYLEQLFHIVQKHSVRLLIPTTDLDLKLLSENVSNFKELNCTVLISKPDVIDICQNKKNTFAFLRDKGFDTPRTFSPDHALNNQKTTFPCFLKPWDGSASKGISIARDIDELEFYSKRVPNCIVQEYILGDEYTCDAFVDLDKNVRCVVPRKRIEVRTGEVSKGIIIKDQTIINETADLVRKLEAGPGVITVQLIKTKDNKLKFIEINPRFGGGVPLSIKAGANFPLWTLQMLTQPEKTLNINNSYRDKLTMLRYDAEVWLLED